MIYRKYGKLVITNSAITLIFVVIITVAIVFFANIWDKSYDLWTKLGTIMTTIGALIAIYIALFFTNKEHIKEVSENHFYKINLLHDLVGILYEILGSIRISIRIQNQHTQDNKDYESLKIKFEGFKYWADRISQINSNIYVPPEIRDAISMFLHQGVKPITFNEFANDKDFVETTVFLHLDRVIESQYMTADKDLSIMKFLGKVQNTKNSILNLLSKNV